MPRPGVENNEMVVRMVQKTFVAEDIERVWNYLAKKFGFNIKRWRQEFIDYADPNNRDKSIPTQFLEFGKIKIEPVLNLILYRSKYPTWIMMISYLLKEKIKMQERR